MGLFDKKPTENMGIYLLVDRSGSMTGRLGETLGGLNAYLDRVAKELPNSLITIATFDTVGGHCVIDYIRRAVRASVCTRLTGADIHPRGGTPLYDAIGRLSAITQARMNRKEA